MARIKFLDVLEETKTKPIYNKPVEETPSYREETSFKTERQAPTDTPRRRALLEREYPARESFAPTREKSILRDNTMAFETGYTGRRSVAEGLNTIKPSNPQSNVFGLEDNKVLWTGALFVLFGGMLFLSGYWVGKTITSNVKKETSIFTAQSFNDLQKNDMESTLSNPTLPNTTQPIASTMDTIPVPPKPMKIIEPTITPAPKKATPRPVVSSKEYIIQVSAHSTIDAARIIEDQLRAKGFPAYTSESVIGDAVFFRVRLRGFNSKKAAQTVLAQVKSKNIGLDGFVLTLE